MNRNATASWSGYSHQGKVGIFVALKKLNELLEENSSILLWKIVYENAEDFDIISESNLVDSRHQVKAKKSAIYPNDYLDVLISTQYDEDDNCVQGFDIKDTPENNRFLHTIVEVQGFSLSEEEFHNEYPRANFVRNMNNIQLYTYPDDNKWCDISGDVDKIKKFCLDELKKVLVQNNHTEKHNESWQKGILDHILATLDNEIRIKHLEASGGFPELIFADIYDLIISNERYKKRSIESARNIFFKTWIEFIEELNDNDVPIANDHELIIEDIVKEIYKYKDADFLSFLASINPDEKINNNFTTLQDVVSFIKKDNIEYVFLECLLHVKNECFNLEEIGYSRDGGYRLTAINKPQGRVGSVIKTMIKNYKFTKDIFRKRFIINGNINNINICDHLKESNNSSWSRNLEISDKFISPNIEFISINKAIDRLE